MSNIAKEHGRKAFHNGYAVTDCPLEYEKTGQSRDWITGWREALFETADREKEKAAKEVIEIFSAHGLTIGDLK